jgi:type IV pilus assembly protein PilV
MRAATMNLRSLPSSTNFRTPKKSRGSTLIEVLVSIVVLSIGLLGIAGLQAATTKYKINTWSRSAATQLLSDLSERVRINPDEAGSNFTTGVAADPLYRLSSTWAAQEVLPPVDKNCDDIDAACTTAERAAFDMAFWRQRVRAALPQGSANVAGDKRNGFEVTLMWFDTGATDKGKAADSQLVKPLVCQGNETGMAQQTCCPAQAQVGDIAGVRCARFSFIP